VARRNHAHGYAPFGGHGFRHFGGPPWWRGRGVLYSALARLDATPSQEKAILGAIDELTDVARELRGTGREARAEVARALSAPTFDDGALASAAARVDEAGHKLRGAVQASLAKIHGVLDDRQRKKLGDLIESGWAPGC
jgi:uncharacterized membrane protein